MSIRKILLAVVALTLAPCALMAQNDGIAKKYAAGTVPVVDGKVVFSDNYKLKGKSKAEIYKSLMAFANSFVKNENALTQCRVSTADEANGLIAVSMEEEMFFKRTSWVTDRTRFYYQLLFQIKDGGYNVMLRNIHYLYDEERDGGITYSAEEWITDNKAIVKKGKKLSKHSGKFRTFTIDRKDAIFKQAYSAAGGKTKKRVKKIIYEEVEE